MAVLKLSQIAAAAGPPAVTDQAVFVTGGTTDNLITVTQLAAGLPVFTSTARGSVPASGGIATTFLNGAGAFTTPTGTPGGVSPQVQFNNAGAFGGMSGTSWDDTNRSLTMTGVTVTAQHPVLDMTQTWNAGGVSFSGLRFNLTNTASASTSKLLELQLGGNTFFAVGIGDLIAGPNNVTISPGNTSQITSTNTLQLQPSGPLQLNPGAGTQNIIIQNSTNVGLSWEGVFVLFRDSANKALSMRASTNAQGLHVYNTFTDNSNFERAAFDWTTIVNTLTIGTQNLGTGSARGINIVTGGTNAITISSAQLVALPAITTDATHTDSTLCQDTTTHAVYFGSGAAGICLGTSSVRYKHGIADLDEGLSQILALRPITYRYNHQPDQDLYGFTAEDVVGVIPRLVRPDDQGRPNSVDHIGMLAVIVNAIKEQQIMIDELKDQLDELSAGKR